MKGQKKINLAVFTLSVILTLGFIPSYVFAYATQSHPLSQISPIDVNLNMSNFNVTGVNWFSYSGGILFGGTQGIPTADIANSAVVSSKIANGAVGSAQLSNPIGGFINASAYYDSDNSNYYLDAAATGTSLKVAGAVVASQFSGTLGWGNLSSFPSGCSGGQFVTAIGGALTCGTPTPPSGAGWTILGNNIYNSSSTTKVGIGTASPVQQLDVVGNINATSTLYGTLGTANAVGTTNIANSAVTSSKIANGAIGSAQLSNPIGGYINATIYYDSDNSAYYADFASTGTSINTAGAIYQAGTQVLNTVSAGTGLTGGGNGPSTTLSIANGGVGATQLATTISLGSGQSISYGSGTINANQLNGQPSTYYLNTTGGVNANTLNNQPSTYYLNTSTQFGGNVTGTYNNLNLAANSVDSSKIVDNSIATADLANSAVTSSKVANGAIGSAQLSNPIGGYINASAYYDSDNSAYYLDAANTGTSLSVAGNIVGGGSNVISNWGDLQTNYVSPKDATSYDLTLRTGNGAGTFLNTITLYHGSTPIIYMNGKVGIGTTNPQQTLDVVGTGNFTNQICLEGDCRSVWPTVTGGGGVTGGGTINYIPLWTNSTNIGNSVIYQGSSKIGIGTTNPQQTLDVVGNINATGTLYGTLGTANAVGTSNIANSAVTSSKIANGAVGSAQLSNPIGGFINATMYYDSDNSNYYLDPANTGKSLNVAGGILAATSINGSSIYQSGTQVLNTINTGTGLSGGGSGPSLTLSNTGVISVSCTTISCSGTNPASFSVPNGAIANAQLANSSITVSAGTALTGGGSVSLGGSTTLGVATGGITSSLIANGAVGSAQLSNPIGGYINASAYYDSDNSAYYLDPAATGTSLNVAGSINMAAGGNLDQQGNTVLRLSDNSNTVVNPIVSGGKVYINWDRGSGIVFGNGAGGQIGSIDNSGNLVVSGTGTFNGAGNNYFAGNVGIGTTTSAPLQVHTTGGGNLYVSDYGCGVYGGIGGSSTLTGCANYALLTSGGDTYINRPTGSAIRFREGNSDQVIIASGGSVGIGTTTPANKLNVIGDVNATTNVYGNAVYQAGTQVINTVTAGTSLTGGGSGPSVTLGVANSGIGPTQLSTSVAGTGLSGGGGSALSVNYGSTTGTAVQGNTQFTISAGTGLTGGGTITEGSGGTLTLNSVWTASGSNIYNNNAGSVGIGTTSPQNKLNVIGDINATGNVIATNILNTTSKTYYEQNFTSSGTWTVPSDVTIVWVIAVGGGGGGGYGSTHGGGGGGGGQSVSNVPVTVTPGNVITVTVGTGGTGGTTNSGYAGNGGSTSFGSLTVNGGYGGQNTVSTSGLGGAGGGGTAGGSSAGANGNTDWVGLSGGGGGAGYYNTNSGLSGSGGGNGAFTGGVGCNNIYGTGGGGGASEFGNGGAGGCPSVNTPSVVGYGGGGGGGGWGGSSNSYGANGAPGIVLIAWWQ